MALYQSDRTIAFRRAYGKAAPPEKLTQEAFEGNDRHLRRLLRIKPGERPDVQDLWEYLHSVSPSQFMSYLYVKWNSSERVLLASAGVVGEGRPSGILPNAAASNVCITSELPVIRPPDRIRRRWKRRSFETHCGFGSGCRFTQSRDGLG